MSQASLPSPIAATHAGWRLAICDMGTGGLQTKEESRMLAAIGLGLVGTILIIVLVIAAIMFFLRRA